MRKTCGQTGIRHSEIFLERFDDKFYCECRDVIDIKHCWLLGLFRIQNDSSIDGVDSRVAPHLGLKNSLTLKNSFQKSPSKVNFRTRLSTFESYFPKKLSSVKEALKVFTSPRWN